ncbi:MAG: cyclic di-GMP phosphodiesterase [Acidobacteriota bacterium]|nr:cyclic di-GMP phosphodiesterase [Acidobacteriota bacterium]
MSLPTNRIPPTNRASPVPRARLLIADEDAGVRRVLEGLLGREYECEAVGSPVEALRLLGAGCFQLVLGGISFERMSGIEFIPRVRALSPETLVVIVGGSQDIACAVESMRAGAFDYLLKPFDLARVEMAVRRALEHQRLVGAKLRYETFLERMIAQRTGELDGALRSLESAYRQTLQALITALETRDSETHGHSERVVAFSLRLGREMRLDEDEMRSLEFGSLLHDIGKIGVPDAVLRKPARLDEAEWREMQLHPVHGRQILRGIEFLEGAARVVAQHHERWDGSGYPLGLKGVEIDLNARIFAVADAFDAITSDRVYRSGRPYESAAAELDRCAGVQFDPRVVAAFRAVPRDEWERMRLCPSPAPGDEPTLTRAAVASPAVASPNATPARVPHQRRAPRANFGKRARIRHF